jgi:hypothetical protein
MNIFYYLLCGFVLFGLNFALIFFVRNERSFTVFPGLIYTILFLCFGAYLFYAVYSLSPADPVKLKKAKKAKTYAPGRSHVDENAEKYTLAQIAFEQRERESKVQEILDSVCTLINLLGFQSILAGISAVVGARFVPIEKRFHYGFVGLYCLLTLLVFLLEVLIRVKYLH